nr:MAG TPA: hypothetical protein [Caudoviricetes sp.]
MKIKKSSTLNQGVGAPEIKPNFKCVGAHQKLLENFKVRNY